VGLIGIKGEKYRAWRVIWIVSSMIKRDRLRWFGHVGREADADRWCMIVKAEGI